MQLLMRRRCSQKPGAVLLRSEGLKWSWLQKQGAEVNPCNSALHPAVLAGLKPKGNERSVQEAYNPSSQCFGCGARAGLPFLDHSVPCLPGADINCTAPRLTAPRGCHLQT